MPLWAWIVVGLLALGLVLGAVVGLTLFLSRNAAQQAGPAAPTSLAQGQTRNEATAPPAATTQPEATVQAQETEWAQATQSAVAAQATQSAIAAEATAAAAGACMTVGQTRVRASDGMEMVCVPAGDFTMGSTDGDPHADANEKPQHTVYLDAFWMDRTEVTTAQFQAFVQETGHVTTAEQEGWGWVWMVGTGKWEQVNGADWLHPQGPGATAPGNHPVVQVSWYDARAYCAWAGAGLPTEAQWEKAARGSDGRIYPWGYGWDSGQCNARESGIGHTTVAGWYAPAGDSPYGCSDMAGNVWEWGADRYGPYSSAYQQNPSGPAAGSERVLRGGSWDYPGPMNTRTAFRGFAEPDGYDNTSGFRCAMPGY